MTDKHLDLELVNSMYGIASTTSTTTIETYNIEKTTNDNCVFTDEMLGLVVVIFFVRFLILLGVDTFATSEIIVFVIVTLLCGGGR